MMSDAGRTAPTGSERMKLICAIPMCETCLMTDTCAGGGICPRGSDQTAQNATVATTQFVTTLDDSAHGNVDDLHFESHKFQVQCNEADVVFSQFKRWRDIAADRVRQSRIDEMSLLQERNPSTVSQLVTQIQDLQNNVNSQEIVTQLRSIPYFPANPCIFRVPDVCSAAVRDCHSIHVVPWVLQQTFLNAFLLEEDPPSALFEKSRNLASSSCGLGSVDRRIFMDRDPQSPSIATARIIKALNLITLEELTLRMVWITRDIRCWTCIFENSWTLWNFECWKVSFNTEVCK